MDNGRLAPQLIKHPSDHSTFYLPFLLHLRPSPVVGVGKHKHHAGTAGGSGHGTWRMGGILGGGVDFHESSVHKMLENNLDKVLAGRTGVRFFFPLCGKAVDMKWLADMGHSVVGVEISEKAIKQFFEESNMTYSEEPVPAIPGAKVYKGSERNISLYQCDFFNFSSSIEGQFGAIWDSGSLVAINPRDREKYAALIMSLMAKDCRYLLDTLLYNPEIYKSHPFFVPDDQVKSLFGECCDVEQLQSLDAMTDLHRGLGLDYRTENVHLITPKSI